MPNGGAMRSFILKIDPRLCEDDSVLHTDDSVLHEDDRDLHADDCGLRKKEICTIKGALYVNFYFDNSTNLRYY